MTSAEIAQLVQAAISAGSGLFGAIIGGLISSWQSQRSIEDSFRNQIEIEELRHRQKLVLEDLDRERDAKALRRSLLRSLKRLQSTARLSPKSRITLKSWEKAADAFALKMEDPAVDRLLSDSQHDALWHAAGEGQAAPALLHIAADGALLGHTPNVMPLRATVELFQRTLQKAFEELSQSDRAAEVAADMARGIAGCGMFLENRAVFYPDPLDGKTFIVK